MPQILPKKPTIPRALHNSSALIKEPKVRGTLQREFCIKKKEEKNKCTRAVGKSLWTNILGSTRSCYASEERLRQKMHDLRLGATSSGRSARAHKLVSRFSAILDRSARFYRPWKVAPKCNNWWRLCPRSESTLIRSRGLFVAEKMRRERKGNFGHFSTFKSVMSRSSY